MCRRLSFDQRRTEMKTPSDILEARRVARIVTKHLLTQNRQALRIDGSAQRCAYRGTDGTKCAIGCLIPDTAYRQGLEGHSLHYASLKQALIAGGVDMSPLVHETLAILQRIHDLTQPRYWPELLAELKAALYVSPKRGGVPLRKVYYSETFKRAIYESRC
jgi:hypothetical protein